MGAARRHAGRHGRRRARRLRAGQGRVRLLGERRRAHGSGGRRHPHQAGPQPHALRRLHRRPARRSGSPRRPASTCASWPGSCATATRSPAAPAPIMLRDTTGPDAARRRLVRRPRAHPRPRREGPHPRPRAGRRPRPRPPPRPAGPPGLRPQPRPPAPARRSTRWSGLAAPVGRSTEGSGPRGPAIMAGPMARSIRLRRWQKEALDLLAEHPGRDFLAVATPGAGKTTFALTAARPAPGRHPAHRRRGGGADQPPQAPVVAGRRPASGSTSSRAWTPADGRLPADMHGVVVTYQQVAANPAALRQHAARLPSSCSTSSTTPATTGPGATPCGRPSSRRRGGWPSRARRSAATPTPSRSSTTRSTRPRPTTSTATSRPWPTGGWCARSGSPASTGSWSGPRPTARQRRASFDDALDRTALRAAAAHRPQPRGRVAARRCSRQANERLMDLRRAPARRRRPRHRHRPGPRPRHRPAAPPAPPGAGPSWRRPTTRRRRAASPASPRAPTRGSSPCAWCPRASTSPACASACSPRRPPPSCSSARPSAASCATPAAGPAASGPGSSSPTTPGCGPGRPPSPSSAATASRRTWEEGERAAVEDDPAALDEVPDEDEQLSLFSVLSAQVVDGASSAVGVRRRRARRRRTTATTTTAASPIDLPAAAAAGRGPVEPRPARGPRRPPAARGQEGAARGQRRPRPAPRALHRAHPPRGQRPPQPPGRRRAHHRGHPRPAPPPGRPSRALDQQPVAGRAAPPDEAARAAPASAAGGGSRMRGARPQPSRARAAGSWP